MPVIPAGNTSFLYSATTPAQTILNSVSQDVRRTLSATVPDDGASVLLDYVNRTSLELLRISRWNFLMSPIQRFFTQLGVVNYWIGPSGQASAGQYDTNLNLTDVRLIADGSVVDRTNFRLLHRVNQMPISAVQMYPDETQRMGRPTSWMQQPDIPNVLSIYPAPDDQNIYTPQPEPPLVRTVLGGTLPDRLYFVTTTFVDSFGKESTAPLAAKIYVPAGFLLDVQAPTEPLIAGTTGVRYDRWNVYVVDSSTVGTQSPDKIATLQNLVPLLNSVDYVEPTTGITTSGVNPPSFNNVQPLYGYFIEFRYYRQRLQIIDARQLLQIPDDYRDVVIAGVNARAFQYLTRPMEAQQWYALYKEGITQIRRDINFQTWGGADYMTPDSAGIGMLLPAVESIDLSALLT